MSRRRPRRRMTSVPEHRPPRWLRSRLLLRAVLWGGLFAGVAAGLAGLDAYAQRQAAGSTRLEWVDLPAWLAEPQWHHVLEGLSIARDGEPLLYPDTDIYHPNVCEFVHAELSRSPWIERVERVWKHKDGAVRVSARFREPFAAVEKNGKAHLVDEQGVRLPLEWRAEFEGPQSWLRVRGVRAGVPEVGARWTGPDLAAGLELVDYLYRNQEQGLVPFRDEIRGVDVSEFDEIIEGLRIITIYPRIYIRWGHVPGREVEEEAPADQKLELLRVLYKEWGRLPDRYPFTIRFAPEVTFDVDN